MRTYPSGTVSLLRFGFRNPVYKLTKHEKEYIINVREIKEMSDKKFKQATSGDVIKFTKSGESVSGVLVGVEESKQYPGSWAVKMRVGDDIKVLFVNNIVIDLFKSNGIVTGMDIMIEYQGKKTSDKSGRDYNDYKVFFAA